MHKVGFAGGSSIVQVGSASAMSAFFTLIRECSGQSSDRDWSLVSDRLFKRYVRQEDAQLTKKDLEDIRVLFSNVQATEINRVLGSGGLADAGLTQGAESLAEAFSRYFDAAFHCIESAEVNFAMFGSDPEYQYKYEPVVVIRSEMPAYVVDSRIPLSDYDELTGNPFWLQPRLRVDAE